MLTDGIIAVSGATGFVGTKLSSALSSNNLRLLVRSFDSNLKYEQIECDFETDKIPDSCFFGVSIVLHLAGYTHDLRDSSEIEHLYRKVNVDATVRLAKLAVKAGVKKFVFLSSVKAGGKSFSEKCLSEIDQKEPDGIYGKTKREAELQLLEIGRESSMHVTIIRSSLVYGPNVKGNLALMMSGIKKGWFPPLPETGNKKSMIHIDDLVSAILLVVKDERSNGEIFIATDGIPHSSREIYNAMRFLNGKSIPKWSLPMFIFSFAALINSNIKFKIDKIFAHECYCSEKLEKLGFSPERNLVDMNKTFL